MKPLIKNFLLTLMEYFFYYYLFYTVVIILVTLCNFPENVKDTLLAYCIPFYDIVFVLLWMKRKKMDTSFLSFPKKNLLACADDVLACTGFDFGLALLVSNLLSMFITVKGNIDFSSVQINPFFHMFVTGVIVPIDEEFFFRGFLMEDLSKYPKIKVALVVSIFFGIAHMNVFVSISAFFLSLLVISLRYKYNSVWPGIFVHMIMNLLNDAAAYLNTDSLNFFDGCLLFLLAYGIVYLFRKESIRNKLLELFTENVSTQ